MMTMMFIMVMMMLMRMRMMPAMVPLQGARPTYHIFIKLYTRTMCAP